MSQVPRRSFTRSWFVLLCLFAWAVGPIYAQDPPGQPELASQDEYESINVGVGQSVVLRSPWPVARVSITAPAIADVQVLTPTQILLTGHALGTTDLFMWSENDELWHAKVSVIIDLLFVEAELRRIFPDAELDVTQSRDVIVVKGRLRRTEDVDHLQKYLDSLTIKYMDMTSVAGVHQVGITVRVAEVRKDARRALGLDATLGLDTRSIFAEGSDIASLAASLAAPTEMYAFSFATSHVEFSLFLEAMAENRYARILANPTLIAMSGEEAGFLAGGEFPIPVVQGGGVDGTSISIEYKEFGVQLLFRPTVLGDGTIRMYVQPEVSELSEIGAVTIQGFSIPSIRTRRAHTTMELKTGQSFAIAGLLAEETQAIRSQLPLLGDLPIIGPLFRSVAYQSNQTELLILVTASLVEPVSANPTLLPGDLHTAPSDWELFIKGRIEGERPLLAPAAATWIGKMGLENLRGPGAWVTHGLPPAPILPATDGPGPIDSGDGSSEMNESPAGDGA